MAGLDDVLVSIPKKRMATYGKNTRVKRTHSFAPTITPLNKKHGTAFSPGLPAARPRTPTPSSGSSSSSSSSIESTRVLKRPSIPSAQSTRSLKRPSPSSAATSGGNVFDVPSSDSEMPSIATRIPHSVTKITTKSKAKDPLPTRKGPDLSTDDSGRNKRVKLSPPPPMVEKVLSNKLPLGKATKPTAATPKLPKNGHIATMVSRPKQTTSNPQKPELLKTSKGLSPLIQPDSNTSSAPGAGLDMMDVDPPILYTSPRGELMWKELLDPAVTVGSTNLAKPPSHEHGKVLSTAATITKGERLRSRRLPRRRLIDSLVEQINDEEEDGDEDREELAGANSEPEIFPEAEVVEDLTSQILAPEVALQTKMISNQVPQNSGPKFTYSRQRSMLAEEDFMAQLAIDMPSQPVQTQNGKRSRRGSIPKITPLSSFHEEEEEGDGASSKPIKNMHELRQAGANTRFLYEIEDMLTQIGEPTSKPSSLRRSSLLELASKFKDKNFVRQFRSNCVEQRLFLHLGQETDTIAGYIMVSILMATLLDANMPHVVPLLRRQGITRLFIRLIESYTPVITLSKERKTNMSKMAQLLISKHQEFVLNLPLWGDLRPSSFSPRTLALKCLEMMVRQTRESGNSSDIISKELTTSLFGIVQDAAADEVWESPSNQKAIDFALALSTLELHSIAARTVHDESIWLSDYLPIVAETLEVALSRPADNFGKTQALSLRLTLNVTNNNEKAANVFARESLMATMGSVVIARFNNILQLSTEENFYVIVDQLVLVLGVMINLADGSANARQSLQNLIGKDNDPLGEIIQLFVDNSARTSDAESLEETQKNVAFGYLSVLLGYLSLSPDIYERIAAQLPQKNMRPLLESIQEFIGHHRVADSQIEAEDEGYSANIGLTERLEKLVVRLDAKNLAYV